MFPNGNVGLENSKFYEDVPAWGHLIAATGNCRKRAFVTLRVWLNWKGISFLYVSAELQRSDDFDATRYWAKMLRATNDKN
jgi:hypothetical protein